MEVFLLMVDKEYEEKLLDIPRNLHSIEHEIRILQTLSVKVRVKRWALLYLGSDAFFIRL